MRILSLVLPGSPTCKSFTSAEPLAFPLNPSESYAVRKSPLAEHSRLTPSIGSSCLAG